MANSTSDSAVDPIEQLLDLFLYAPIGLVAKGADSLPDLVQRGRSQASNARVVGQFALGASNAKVRKSLADAEQHLHAFLKIVAESSRVSTARSTASAAAGDTASAEPEAADDRLIDDLIPDYDSLTAAQVLPLLAGMTPAQLSRVETYELAKRSRKTVLNRIRQLRNE